MLLTDQPLADKDAVMVSYRGDITEELITSILEFVEQRFRELKAAPNTRRKIVSVLVETLQNIFHHAQPPSPDDPLHPEATVLVCQQNHEYLVVTGNRIKEDKALELRDRIDRINAMSRDELNSSYRHILATRQKSSPTGSGVGIIDIARRSGQKIEVALQPIEEGYYFFNMQVKIAV